MTRPTERLGRDYGPFEGVRILTMNGVRLYIVNKQAATEANLKDHDLIPLGGGKYAHTLGLTRDKLYRAAGYDVNKIDFAVPQPWYDLPENRARRKKGDRAVWSYAGRRNTFGKPIWDSEALKRLKTRINQRLRR